MTSPLFGLGSAAERTRARERARYERALRKATAQLARARRREAQGAGQRIASIDITLGLRRATRERPSASRGSAPS